MLSYITAAAADAAELDRAVVGHGCSKYNSVCLNTRRQTALRGIFTSTCQKGRRSFAAELSGYVAHNATAALCVAP